MPARVLADNRPETNCKLITSLCEKLGIEALTTTENYSQADKHAKRFNQVLVSSLLCYVAEQGRNLLTFLPLLTSAHSGQVDRAKN